MIIYFLAMQRIILLENTMVNKERPANISPGVHSYINEQFSLYEKKHYQREIGSYLMDNDVFKLDAIQVYR
jgi:hypothetical protein